MAYLAGLTPAGLVEILKLLYELLIVHLNGLCNGNELVLSLLEAFLVHETLLIELLARTQTGVDDLDVHVGLVACKLDEVPRHVVDLHGLAHVEHEDLAALCVAGALQHQAHGLGDGHEEARDARVGHRDGAALCNLLLEQRHHRSVGAQYVAKAHGHVVRVLAQGIRATVHHLHHHLAQALARAHHVGGVHGFIGADEHEALGAVVERCLSAFERAEDVVLDGLAGAVLH